VGGVMPLTTLPRGDMASDIFARIGDIKGESLDAKHKDEIEVTSFSWGVNNTMTPSGGAGAGAGKANFQTLNITHTLDKASPLLLQACATGTHIKDATITHRKSGKSQQEFLVIKMNDVVITGVSHGGPADFNTSETVSLSFAKIDFEYRAQKPDGSLDPGLHFTFDLQTNKTF
jgi:type VI secretion system secreted protein Hcp